VSSIGTTKDRAIPHPVLDGYADEKLRVRQVLKEMQKEHDSLGEQQTKEEMQQVEQTMIRVLQRMRGGNMRPKNPTYQKLVDACGTMWKRRRTGSSRRRGKYSPSPWTLEALARSEKRLVGQAKIWWHDCMRYMPVR
jgi:hypothetical protein